MTGDERKPADDLDPLAVLARLSDAIERLTTAIETLARLQAGDAAVEAPGPDVVSEGFAGFRADARERSRGRT